MSVKQIAKQRITQHTVLYANRDENELSQLPSFLTFISHFSPVQPNYEN